AGPNQVEIHYTLPPLSRWDLQEVLQLIQQRKYFVLHAPHQTGKTTCLLELMHHLNTSGEYKALYVNFEPAQAARENVSTAMKIIYNRFATSESNYWKTNELDRRRLDFFEKNLDDLLSEILSYLSRNSTKPVVILIDEIDSLVGDTLISVLRQIRAGYADRPQNFPQSIILCGVRDIRDYRIHSSGKEIVTGGSAFNIKAKSLRLGNFSQEEIFQLYNQHTQETGQLFAEEIFPLVWDYTDGQPWLVNALAFEVCFEIPEGKDRKKVIDVELIRRAKENLVLRRDTHLDQLIDKLKEERVRRVILPILQGDEEGEKIPTDDIQYVIDLGLVKQEKNLKIANSIYAEIIPRELTFSTQVTLVQEDVWYLDKNTNKLQISKLLQSFQEFFREHSESWLDRFDYKEAGPQLLLQAFLQRVINGGGYITREYGLGRRRTDLFIEWYTKAGDPTSKQKIVIECKLIRKSFEKALEEGLEQVLEYKDKCGAEEAHLILFDKREGRTWEEKIFYFEREHKGKQIHVWGM
ncbi:MAG: ATP-binding protein, partial [Leptospiraceae bacterium]|nr:ATP-binding protein [Leptospiraceae bacterium]